MPAAATTLLLIRHGETEWNRRRVFRGTADVPLNETGRRQAELVAQALAHRRIEAAFTSPLSRARETARIALSPLGIEPRAEERLRDICYGKWQGRPEEEVARLWPEELERWRQAPQAARPPGGETLREVQQRAAAAMEEIAGAHPGGTVALFSHRVVCKLLVLQALGLGPERFPSLRLDNCSLSALRWREGNYTLVLLNDTCHIRRAGTGVLEEDF